MTPRSNRKRIVLWVVSGLLVLVLGALTILVYSVLKRPKNMFTESVLVTATPAAAATPVFDIEAYLSTDEPGATPLPMLAATSTAAPESKAMNTADPNITLSGIVNVALFGIDAYEDGGTTSGTMPHTDANMIIAINFDTREVSLISIARDVFTNVPGRSGFYKFNGVFNVGGGMADPKGGLELSCRTAEMWLGGVSVPYYYGVDFQAVIDLVDALGGINYDLDINLYNSDRKLIAYKGEHHLNGEQVLAYLRARKMPGAGGLDSLRTARQRKMMIALFKKIKEEGKLSIIPELLKIMGDNVYTNTSLAQTAALANFAKNVDPDAIRSYSITGDMAENYLWRYCMIDQQARLDILKAVYGIDASPLGVDTRRYESFLYDSGFMAIQHVNIAKKLFEEVHANYSESAMTEAQKRAYADCWKRYTDLESAFNMVNEWMLTFWDDSKDMTRSERNQQSEYYKILKTLESKVRSSGDAMKKTFDLETEANWNRSVHQWFAKGSVINEVYVDFR